MQKNFLHCTDKQIEAIINWRMRTYEKGKAVKSADNILHNTDKQFESIINWRMRTYEKEKAAKNADNFFAQHKQFESIIN